MSDEYAIDNHKLHYHVDKLNHWKYGAREFLTPIYVEISPVGYCNQRCSFCALDYLEYKATKLDTANLKFQLTDMKECGVRSVMFAGEGEPLLHPDMAEIIKWAKGTGLDVAVTTNGTVMDRKFVDTCLKDLSWIRVSLNAGTPQVYNQIHNPRSKQDWYKVWENISYAVLNKHDTTIGIQSIVLEDNICSMKDLVERAKFYGVDYVTLKPYSQHGKSINKNVTPGTYTHIFQELKKRESDKFKVIVRKKAMVSSREGPKYERCLSVPYFWAYIMSTGDIYGCSAFLGDERFKYGNIKDGPFSYIWRGGARRDGMRYMLEHDVKECRKACRMDRINEFLWDIENPKKHGGFI